MAWTAVGYDENTGKVRWNGGAGQDQYLDPGQDPNVGVAADPFGWNPNAVMPTGGWSAGALLQPNYGPTLDMNDQSAVAAALRDVAPNYAPVMNTDGTINLNDQVDPNTEQRAPAKDPAFESLLGAGALAGLGYLSGGFGLSELFNGFGGNGLSFNTASGGMPTQVGSSFMDGLTTTPDALNAAIDAADVVGGGDMLNLGGQSYQQFLQSLGGSLPNIPGGGSLASGGSTAGGGAASAAAGTVGGGSATAGAGSAMSRILDGSATSADWLSLAGTGGSTLLGMLGSQQQTQAYKDLAKQYMDFGAPSRARFEASMSPGFDVNSIPGYKGAVDTASESLLRRLSATGGNPYGNPGGLIEANKAIISGTALPAYNEYARLNANTGFGSSMNAAVPFQTAAIGSDGNSLNALGAGLAQLTQPPKQDLASLLKQYQGFGGLSLT